MEVLFTCGLALLEMTFIFAALMLLHALRKQIGPQSFYFSLGLLLIFTQLVGATELKILVSKDSEELDFYIAQTVLFLPYLAILLTVYVTEGTLAAQRMIIGAMAALGLYLYLSKITAVQCGWAGNSISQGPSADSLEYLLFQSKRSLASSILAQTLDLFLIPIFFQRLQNLKCRLFISVLGALMLTQMIHSLVYISATFWGQPAWWYHITSSYVANILATFWLSMLVTLYLSKIERERPGEGRGTLDIVFAFFGAYGKAQMLQKNLQEWTGRYRMVVENASDLILVLDKDETILDANLAAMRIFKILASERIIGKKFPTDFMPVGERAGAAAKRWNEQINKGMTETQHIKNIPIIAVSATGDDIDLEISISRTKIEENDINIVFGRDVTEQNRLNRERENLRDQLHHAQRLESVGRLAGGVAHDFNNYLHAIQGHLDILFYMHDINDEKVESHLESIDKITGQAAELTHKLLGFARKGKYIDTKIEMNELINESIDLFMPASQRNIDLHFTSNLPEVFIQGDKVQMQQVFLNTLINARDALENVSDEKMRIDIYLDEAVDSIAGLSRREKTIKDINLKDYICVQVIDTGTGMDKKTLAQIFDPFFTTKPIGKGTGMGLSMVYGTITNHGGVIDVQSKRGEGTTFSFLLPKAT
ncbi:MAG: PAS domain-containing protein [Kiritimatiellaeota bacterium]|nr:PAS domain-containing protein [Kiritimatiellota bacterium]